MKKLLLSLAFLLCSGLAHGQCGPPNYACSYSGVDIKNWPGSIHSFGVQQNNFTSYFDTTLLPANPSAVIRCTDQLLEGNTATGSTIANQSKSGGLGGSGESKWLFNSNSTLVHYNTSSGQGHITLFDPTIPKCGDPVTGHAITADKNDSNPGLSSVVYNFGNGSFDTTDAGCTAGHSCFYSTSNGSDNTTNTVVVKYIISQTDGRFTVIKPYIDMAFGFPIGVQAATYQSSHGYSIGDYVQVPLSLSNWDNTTAWVLGDVIFPTTNNPGNCAFKLVTVGTRGSQPNPWSAAGSCVNSQNKVEGSGSETWKNIGHNGTFVFQATTGGTSSAPGSTPSFGTSFVHPDIGSVITDNTVTWVNSGGLISPTWQAFGNSSTDGSRFCFAYSNNTYGHTGAYTNDNGGQGSGFYTECYNFTTNKFVLLNTITGVQDTTTCSGGTGYDCSPGTGTLSKLTGQGAALAAVASGCAFYIHGDKGGSTQDFNVISVQTKLSGSCPTIASGTGLLMDWQPFATFNTTTTLQAYNTASGHFSIGKSKLVNFNNSSLNFGFDSGANNIILDSNTPTGAAVTSWQFGAPFTAACEPHTSWFWGDPVPPCRYVDIYDSHTVIWNDGPDDDLGPACGTFYDAQTGHATPGAPGIGEVMCVSTTPTWTVPGTIGAYKLSRFTHTYCMMTNVFFDVQFCVGQLSPDGKWFAFSSDWNCSFGDTQGNATNLCGPPWSPNTPYPLNTLINPFQFLSGSGANYGVYKVTSVGSGNSAATAPAWFTCNAGTVGNTITDANNMQYTCQGAGNAKGELMIVSLAPTPGVNSPTVLTPFIVPLGY